MRADTDSPEQVGREGLHDTEAARMIGCGRTTVWKLIRQRRLRVVKLGTRTIVPRNEVLRLLGEATSRDGDAA